tara:strand:- start:96 stop:344 length:249 start_codon:yes stop_codon:yes gene_type:complete
MFSFIYKLFKGFTPESFIQAHVWFEVDCVDDIVEYRKTIDFNYHYIIDKEIVARIDYLNRRFPECTQETIYDYVSDPKVTEL